MPAPLKVSEGDQYGRLTIIREVEKARNGRRFLCKCICGNRKEVNLSKLSSGNTRSCGCLQKDSRGKSTTTHGMTGSRLYNIWGGMKARCENSKSTIFAHYGGRGIKVDKEWEQFTTFMEWAVANGYKDELTLERKNVDGNYEPGNCEWVSMHEQNLNRRNTLYIEYKGEIKPLKTWCRELGKSYLMVWKRLDKGLSVEESFESEYRKRIKRKTV